MDCTAQTFALEGDIKLEQLEKGIRRKRPATQRAPQHTRPAARHNRRSFLETLPAVPPPLVLRSPDPHAHRILQQWRQAEARQNYTVIERAPSTEEEPMSPLTPLDLEGLGSPTNIAEEYFNEDAGKLMFVSHQLWEEVSAMRGGGLSTGQKQCLRRS
ncbi:hypothetical protein N7490_006268 [Penicillium lividum]|nr:hypothetical protein N7490_006268 [Penicillium lividum]